MSAWPRRAPVRPVRPPRPTTAVEAMMADEHDDRPLGGHQGEWLPARPAEPAPSPPEPFVIEPAPWHGREGEEHLDESSPATPPAAELSAVDAIRAADYEPAELDLRPPAVVAPLIRPRPPEPDWRREEAEALERQLAEAEANDLALGRYPAPKRRPKP